MPSSKEAWPYDLTRWLMLLKQRVESIPLVIGIGDIITGFTPGSVVFVGPLGAFAEDNAHLFWNDTSNFLGIGTATPAALLHIKGIDGFGPNSPLYIGQSDDGIHFRNAANSVEYGTMMSFSTGVLGLEISTSNTARALCLQTNAGPIGIGTKAPTSYLHLHAGQAGANKSPLKFTSGPLLTVPEVGALEFLTDGLYFTITTGAARKGILFDSGTALTPGRVPFVAAGGTLTDDSDLTFATDTLTATNVNITTFAYLGGTTASFPALTHTGADLLVRLGDNTAYANLKSADVYAQQNSGGTGTILLGGIAADRGYGGIWIGQAVPSFSNYSMLANSSVSQLLFNAIAGGDIEFRVANSSRLSVGASGISINEASNTIPSIPILAKNAAKSVTLLQLTDAGLLGVGIAPTAVVHLKAGTTTANTAPLKFTSGTNLTAAEAGAVEFTTDDFFATITTGAARKAFVLDDGTRLTSGRVPFATTNGRLTDDSDLTFATDTLTATKLSAPTSVSTGTLAQTGKTITYNNIATAGWGEPAIYASARATAQVAANASVATYTCGAADGSFLVSANVNVTTSTAHTFTVECAYTDETNTARVLTLPVVQLAGTIITAITNVTGAGPYEGIAVQIRCKASTAITIRTQAAGTYTTVVFNVEGLIQQVA